jgi:hypothetical protein
MKIYWKIERKSGYKKVLQTLTYNGKKFESIEYLTKYIPGRIEEFEFIYVGFDSDKNNVWNCYWTWSCPCSHSEKIPFEKDSIYAGIYSQKKERKDKLEKLGLSEDYLDFKQYVGE